MQATKFIGSPLLPNYAYSCNFFNLNSIYAQSLRWKRKPIWLPTAKTKVFRVPVKPKIPKEEFIEIQRLYNNYRTYYRSVRNTLIAIYGVDEVALDQSVCNKAEEVDFNESFKINDAWNKQVAAEREIRISKEKEEKAAQIQKHKDEAKARKAQTKLQLNEKIKEQKNLFPTFITRDNIDEAIEKALSNVENPNQALNPNGTWYTETSKISNTQRQKTKNP